MIHCFLKTSCVFLAFSVIALTGETSDKAIHKGKVFTLPGGAELEMVWMASGMFTMGSPESENEREDNEIQHKVTISKGFWIGKYEITQMQWEKVMNTQPWEGQVFFKKRWRLSSRLHIMGSYSGIRCQTKRSRGQGNIQTANRSGMGICLSCRDRDSLLFR